MCHVRLRPARLYSPTALSGAGKYVPVREINRTGSVARRQEVEQIQVESREAHAPPAREPDRARDEVREMCVRVKKPCTRDAFRGATDDTGQNWNRQQDRGQNLGAVELHILAWVKRLLLRAQEDARGAARRLS